MARFISSFSRFASAPNSFLAEEWRTSRDHAQHREAVLRVSHAIEANPAGPVDLPALCRLAEMSPMHLEQVFYRCHGVPLQAYAHREWELQRRRWQCERGRPRTMARAWVIAAI